LKPEECAEREAWLRRRFAYMWPLRNITNTTIYTATNPRRFEGMWR